MIRLRTPVTPSLWFDRNAEEAVEFYTSTFEDSRTVRVVRYPEGGQLPAGTVLSIDFELGGRPFNAINGGPHFSFDEAVSFIVEVDDQAENDEVWAALLAGGGEESQCGWLRDRFGVSWQVVPRAFFEMTASDDADAVARVYAAMLPMTKLDLAELQAAFEGR